MVEDNQITTVLTDEDVICYALTNPKIAKQHMTDFLEAILERLNSKKEIPEYLIELCKHQLEICKAIQTSNLPALDEKLQGKCYGNFQGVQLLKINWAKIKGVGLNFDGGYFSYHQFEN